MREQGPRVRRVFGSTRAVPTVLVGLESTRNWDGLTTTKYILLNIGEAYEALLTHELGHWYLEGGPLKKLPPYLKEGLVCMVDWELNGHTEYLIQPPSDENIDLALTRTQEDYMGRGKDDVSHQKALWGALWICAEIGFDRLVALCSEAHEGDLSWIQGKIRELLPATREDLKPSQLGIPAEPNHQVEIKNDRNKPICFTVEFLDKDGNPIDPPGAQDYEIPPGCTITIEVPLGTKRHKVTEKDVIDGVTVFTGAVLQTSTYVALELRDLTLCQ